jgi:transposase-like protein
VLLDRTFCSGAKRDAAAAERFMSKGLRGNNHPAPRVINTDKDAAYRPPLPGSKPKAI